MKVSLFAGFVLTSDHFRFAEVISEFRNFWITANLKVVTFYVKLKQTTDRNLVQKFKEAHFFPRSISMNHDLNPTQISIIF